MTNEEAINVLRRFKPIDQGFCNDGISLLNNYGGDAVETAIEALEKQTAKKPTHKYRRCGFVVEGCCGNCGCSVLPSQMCCSLCGQNIDWSDEE